MKKIFLVTLTTLTLSSGFSQTIEENKEEVFKKIAAENNIAIE